MPRKPLGKTAMTDAERQARYRARARPANRSSACDARLIIVAEPGVGPIMSPVSWKPRLSTLRGWKACRKVFRTARPPRHYGRSAIWTSPNCRRSNLLAASAGTNRCLTKSGGLHRWVHKNPPRAAASACAWALRVARVPPMDYRHKPPSRGGQFWTPIGGQYSTPIDSVKPLPFSVRNR
jgi:hypothetical protein